jgi:hypothetical protein
MKSDAKSRAIGKKGKGRQYARSAALPSFWCEIETTTL